MDEIQFFSESKIRMCGHAKKSSSTVCDQRQSKFSLIRRVDKGYERQSSEPGRELGEGLPLVGSPNPRVAEGEPGT